METLKNLMRKPLAWVLAIALVLAGALAAADTSWYESVLDGIFQGNGSLAADAGAAGANQGASGSEGQQDTLIGGSIAINNKLTWEKINALPTKTENMTIAEARQICVDFFRFTKTTLWTPSENIRYIRNKDQKQDYMTTGVIYGGLPYVTMASGNVYRLMDYIDESTGVVDMRDALNLTGNSLSETLSYDRLKYFGGQCSLSAYSGWGRVINSISEWWTGSMTPAHGFVLLADYDAAKLGNYWSEGGGYNQETAVKNNQEAKMFDAYAKLQPADGLVKPGHTIMCSVGAHVKRDANGNIDGNNSYIYIIDQSQTWADFTNQYGDNYQAKDCVDTKKTFQELYTECYFPFTFKEFLDEKDARYADILKEYSKDPIEATTASFSYTGSDITKSQLFSGKVTANYGISDVYAIVTNGNGEEVYRHVARTDFEGNGVRENVNGEVKFELDLTETGANVDFWGTFPTGGANTVEVVVQLATGERLTLYTGNLVN